MSSSFYLTGRYAYYNTGFGLVPQGGLDQQRRAQPAAAARRSAATSRGSTSARSTRSTSTRTISRRRVGDIKIGGGWRRSDAFTGTLWPGNMILAFDNSATQPGRARVSRRRRARTASSSSTSTPATRSRRTAWTIDLGVRYDRQWGKALPSEIASNAGLPNVVPGVNFPGYDAPFTWNNFSPRAGVTYALDESRKTILRASFSRYAGQLDTGTSATCNPSSAAGYADYGWNDLNGDHLAQENEVLLNQFIGPGGGFNPANPTSVTSANLIDPDLEAPMTTSVVAGIDRELMPNLALQANYSFTRTTDFAGATTVHAVDRQYRQRLLAGRGPHGHAARRLAVQRADVHPEPGDGGGGGQRPHPHELGRLFQPVQRARAVARQADVGSVDGARRRGVHQRERVLRREPARATIWATRRALDTEPLVNGGAFVVRSARQRRRATSSSTASGSSARTACTRRRAGSISGRRSSAARDIRSLSTGPARSVSTDRSSACSSRRSSTRTRLDDLWNLDLRAAKSFRWDRASFELIADLFNVMNSNTDPGAQPERRVGRIPAGAAGPEPAHPAVRRAS